MAPPADNLVLDASVGIKWQLADEEHSDHAQELLRRYRAGTLGLIAPTHLHYEVFNALIVASRIQRPRLTAAAVLAASDEFLQLGIPTLSDDVLLRAARAIAYRWGCAFYDGLYLALAERLDIPLITADRKLYTLAADHPLLLWIADYLSP